MAKRLTRTGNSLALVFDKPLLDAIWIDANISLEVSTDGTAKLRKVGLTLGR